MFRHTSNRWAALLFISMALLAASLACNVSLTSPNEAPTQVITQTGVAIQATPASPEPATAEPPTAEPTQVPTVAPTAITGPTEVIKATPSFIPYTSTPVPPTLTPVPTVVLPAKVCSTCDGLRVRESPGTSGKLIVKLAPDTPISIIGRTMDGTWYVVVMPDGRTGWGFAQFIVLNGDVKRLNIIPAQVADLPTSTAGALRLPTGTVGPLPDSGNIVSGVTSTSRKIFLYGQTRGNLATVFTRVGDSLTAAPQFLHPLAAPHDLGQYGALDMAVSWFSGPNARGANPFIAASMAERNNWTTRDVLDPGQAPDGTCQANETPLTCEYRMVKPSVSLILIGTNDAARDVSPAEYQNNLQNIVQTSIGMGIIPVLSTLPPKHLDAWNNGRVDEFNAIIVTVARANDIPLWNFWLALQPVPNQGINPDGVHLNAPPDGQNATFDAGHLAYGFPVRNLTALQVLDTLRRQVLYGGATPVGGPPPDSATKIVAGSTARPCDGAPLPQLRVGGKGRVTPGLPNKLRAGPHRIDTVIGSMPGGATFSVIGGPICSDGFRWWQINYNGLNAWTADGQGAEYWLTPAG